MSTYSMLSVLTCTKIPLRQVIDPVGGGFTIAEVLLQAYPLLEAHAEERSFTFGAGQGIESTECRALQHWDLCDDSPRGARQDGKARAGNAGLRWPAAWQRPHRLLRLCQTLSSQPSLEPCPPGSSARQPLSISALRAVPATVFDGDIDWLPTSVDAATDCCMMQRVCWAGSTITH